MNQNHPAGRSGFYCRIKFRNHLDNCWIDWFDGLSVETLDNGQVMVSGLMQDQPAMFGLLNKVRDLNLKVMSLDVREMKEVRHDDDNG